MQAISLVVPLVFSSIRKSYGDCSKSYGDWFWISCLSISSSSLVKTADFSIAWKMSESKDFSSPNFPTFGVNTRDLQKNLQIQYKSGKFWTRKTLDSDIFQSLGYFWPWFFPWQWRNRFYHMEGKEICTSRV